MWCDNCLLVLPLRAGTMAWAAIMLIYSALGCYFLFHWGNFLFFSTFEPYIFAGIALLVAVVAIIEIIALSNRSYIWVRVCKFLWPVLFVLSVIRLISIAVILYQNEGDIDWECENGGQLWGSAPEPTDPSTSTLPSTICDPGFHTLYTLMLVGLVVDLVFQLYIMFLNWRYSKRLEHYNTMKGPMMGGYYYNA